MHATRNAPREDHRLPFLRGFLNRPKEVGSIIPSSRFMEKRIVNTAGLADAKLAIELGPGSVRHILRYSLISILSRVG